MPKHLFHALLFVLGATLLLTSCESSNCPDDVCEGAEPVTARFVTIENLNGFRSATDTFVMSNRVIFAAAERYDSYQWKVGFDDRIWTDSSFTLKFGPQDLNAGESIDVTLIASRAPDLECNPDDDGIDTLTKTIVGVNIYTTPVLGTYYGANASNPSDSFKVEIFWKREGYLVMNNINRGCVDTVGRNFALINKHLGGNAMTFNAGGLYDTTNCRNPIGVVHVDDGKIMVEYEYDHDRIKDVFTGHRIDP